MLGKSPHVLQKQEKQLVFEQEKKKRKTLR